MAPGSTRQSLQDDAASSVLRPREIVVVSLAGAAAISLFFALMGLLDSADFSGLTAGMLLLTALMPVAVMTIGQLYWKLLMRRGFLTAALCAAGLVVVISVAAGYLVVWLNAHTPDVGGPGAWLAVAAGWALVCLVLARLWRPPADPVLPGESEDLEDEQWLTAFRARLRGRNDVTEQQVQRHVDDAVQVAARKERPLAELFGTPASMARGITADGTVRARRGLLLYGLILLLASWALVSRWQESGGEFTPGMGFAVLWVFSAVLLVVVTLPQAFGRARSSGSAHAQDEER